MSEELHGGQKELDKNKNGEIDSEDLAIMRGDKEKEVTEITVGETKYKVVEESVTKLTEALSKTTNKEIIKEDMEFFNKMINYKK
jgi:formiminotetrahydrofolate cyclodeaminase